LTGEKEKMDMNARNQYLKVLQGKYFMATLRKEKRHKVMIESRASLLCALK